LIKIFSFDCTKVNNNFKIKQIKRIKFLDKGKKDLALKKKTASKVIFEAASFFINFSQ
jgi:hypothetical protein